MDLWSVQHQGELQVKFRVLPFRVKIKSLALIGCAWQWPCWRHCFESGDYLQGEDPRSLIGQRRRWCTVSFLEASLLEYLTSGVVLVVVVLLLQGLELCGGLFLFSFSLIYLFFWLCASARSFGLAVVAEAECNWYLRDINIYSLSKKNIQNLTHNLQWYSDVLNITYIFSIKGTLLICLCIRWSHTKISSIWEFVVTDRWSAN